MIADDSGLSEASYSATFLCLSPLGFHHFIISEDSFALVLVYPYNRTDLESLVELATLTSVTMSRIPKIRFRFSPHFSGRSRPLCSGITRRFALVLLFARVAIAPTSAKAGNVEVRYTFADPMIASTSNASCTVAVEGCDTFYIAGKPQLPFRTARILLPLDASVKGLELELLAPVEVFKLEAPVAFGRTPLPISEANYPEPDAPDLAVYLLDESYPESRIQLMSVQKLHGYSIAIVRIFPVQYKPLSATLLFCPELRVNVIFDEPKTKVSMASLNIQSTERTKLVMDFVDNPQEVMESGLRLSLIPMDPPIYDYLLITTVALTNSFQPLVEQKIADGLSVKVSTVADILSTSTGVDDAAKLRAYIAQAYTNWGVVYVLLGGDVGTVPHRGAYAYASGSTETNMACDLYFACLDGTWNSDGDAYWGEPTDGEGGADVDLVAEVYVGRAPVDSVAEADCFVEKTLRYEQGGHNNAEKALFLGGQLGDGAQGGDALNPLLPSFGDFTVSWLDDRPAITNVWTTADALAALNSAPHLVADFGHANKTLALRMSVGDLAGLTNADPFLVNSGGCYSGWFDYEDCFAEEMVKGSAAGAFALIMNTRYGWYAPTDEARYTGQFMQKFFDRLLVRDAESIGAAHFLAKQDMIGHVEKSGNMFYRWCYFENTLFGDPHVALQHDALDLQPETGYEATGYVGGPFIPVEKAYTIANASTSVLSWVSSQTVDWLSVSPESGMVVAGTTIEGTLSFNANAEGLMPGDYSDVVTFSNTVSGYVTSRPVALSVVGNMSLEASMYSVMEGSESHVLISVRRAANTNLTASIDFATLDITALAGSDYVATNGTLTFAIGEASKSIAVEILNDEISENDESFKLVLSNPTGFATLQAPYEALVTIQDNDWLDHFEWGGIAPEQTVGSPFEVTATAFNRTGGLLTGFTGVCDLYAVKAGSTTFEVPSSIYYWPFPMSCYQNKARMQAIYTPEEVGGAGLLTALSLHVRRRPPIPLNEWTIRVKYSTLPHYEAASWQWETNDWVVAVQTNLSLSSIGWKRFGFTTPFVYDGTNNLMVDFSVNNSTSASTDGECYVTITSTNRCLFTRNNGENGDPLYWNGRAPSGSIMNVVPSARFERRSLLWSTPSQTGGFTNGMWTGEVVMLESATNAVLSLYDKAGHGGGSSLFDVAWLGLAEWLTGYGIPSDGSADDRDDDHDGFANRAEWMAGTNPTNDQARLCIESVATMGADGAFIIQWQSVPGKRYRVESAETLLPPLVFTPFASNILGVAESTEIKDTRSASTESRFYRIGVE